MMTIEEQIELLMKTFPHLENVTLRALSSSGVIWVTNWGDGYQVRDGKAIKLKKTKQ